MATKKITDLQLISAVVDELSVPADNGIQTYRFTIAQLSAFVRSFLQTVETITGAGTEITDEMHTVFLNPTGASFTQALEPLADYPDGFEIVFKNIATNGNTATLQADGSEQIDTANTLELGSSPVQDSVRLKKSSTKWNII